MAQRLITASEGQGICFDIRCTLVYTGYIIKKHRFIRRNISISEPMHKSLVVMSEKKGMSVSVLIRVAVGTMLDEEAEDNG